MVRRVPKNVKVPVLQFCWRIGRPLARIFKWYQADEGEFVCYILTPSGQPDFGIVYKPNESVTTLEAAETRMLFKREHHFDAEAS